MDPWSHGSLKACGSKRLVDPKLQGYRGMRVQGYNGYKDTRVQGYRGTRVQGTGVVSNMPTAKGSADISCLRQYTRNGPQKNERAEVKSPFGSSAGAPRNRVLRNTKNEFLKRN